METSLLTVLPERTCREKGKALKDAIYLLGGKWKPCIISALWSGSKRFTELQEHIIGITPKVLTKELQEMEMNYLITRTVNHTKPVSVSYTLTEHAYGTQKVFDALVEFGFTHRKMVIGK
ncbi:MAG TPA: helix-turn-helix domain-containing protein [Chitinophaga sp.]|uniref:winged helix-turn-helix transcriptional regulator n=1 Tax=Chitinophaga sp. TaxID=1869181 RepID=UPI002BE0F2E4|nr:helix-turn-helix domain-containing protein [Chitinophaga sp.]HVI48642.1 helix-turn-helix domain-containing protein [Chitinophaga sp.]